MYGKWRVGNFPDEVWIVRAFGATVPASASRISPASAAFSVSEWFADDGLGRALLTEIHEEIAVTLSPSPRLSTERMRERVREAFERGALWAYRVQVMLSATIVEAAPEQPKAPEPEAKQETTFIMIELVDDADPPRPVAFEKYRIDLPDGSTKEGMLDDQGCARIEGIDPGTCYVTFPGQLREDWWLHGGG